MTLPEALAASRPLSGWPSAVGYPPLLKVQYRLLYYVAWRRSDGSVVIERWGESATGSPTVQEVSRAPKDVRWEPRI